MSRKLTVSEYAKEFNTSVQSVYQRIKRNTLKCVKENGIKYVVVESDTGSEKVVKDIKPNVQSEFKYLVKLIKRLQNQIEDKDHEIKRLTKKLEKCNGSKEKVLVKYIQELKQLQITSSPEEEIIDIESKKSKKKSKKSKKKK